MTDEEIAVNWIRSQGWSEENLPSDEFFEKMQTFLAGLKTGKDMNVPTKWHNVAAGDLPKGEKYGRDGVHRDIYLKDRYGNLYTGNYFPKDESHEEDCFAVEILGWGFQGSQFCKKKQISEWCEIPQYTEE